MSLKRGALKWLCLAVALGTLFAALPADATVSLQCQDVWSGPSADNDIIACLSNTDRIKSQWRQYVYPGICALLTLALAIAFPICFCCHTCQCCCCSPRRCAPQTKRAQENAKCFVWMWLAIALLWGAAVCVLVILGTHLMKGATTDVLDQVNGTTLEYFVTVRDKIVSFTTDYTVDPPQPNPNINLTEFTNVEDKISDSISTVRSDYFKYVNTATYVSYGVGAVGLVLTLLVVPLLCCHVKTCLPAVYAWVYWFFGILFGLLAIFFSVGTYASFAGCGEITLQYTRQPGILQWYVVPWCGEQFSFEDLRQKLKPLEVQYSNDACTQVLTFCDNDASTGGSSKYFECGKGITAGTDCSNFLTVYEVITETTAKPLVKTTLCSNTTGLDYTPNCTIPECSEYCVDYTTPDVKAKTLTTQALVGAQQARNASTALSYAQPLLHCDFLVDKLAEALSSTTNDPSLPDVSNCSNLRTSFVMASVGFLLGMLMFCICIYISLRNKCVWDKVCDVMDDVDSVDNPFSR